MTQTGNNDAAKTIMFAGKEMRKEEIGLYVSSILCVLGTFMPYYTISFLGASQSINFISQDGKFIFVLCILGCGFLWYKKYLFTFISSILSLAIVLLNFFSDFGVTEGIGKHDFGAYICLISSVAMLICSAILFLANKKENGNSTGNYSDISDAIRSTSDAVKNKINDVTNSNKSLEGLEAEIEAKKNKLAEMKLQEELKKENATKSEESDLENKIRQQREELDQIKASKKMKDLEELAKKQAEELNRLKTNS